MVNADKIRRQILLDKVFFQALKTQFPHSPRLHFLLTIVIYTKTKPQANIFDTKMVFPTRFHMADCQFEHI